MKGGDDRYGASYVIDVGQPKQQWSVSVDNLDGGSGKVGRPLDGPPGSWERCGRS